jgi:hypothetical protein
MMKAVHRRFGLVFLALGVIAVGGCGQSAPKLVPVSGMVVNGDKPVANATIQFAPESSQEGQGLDAIAQTDKKGHFTVQTVPYGKGAVVGRYKVTVYSEGPARLLIPAKFQAISTTTLRVDIVAPGTEDLKLDLSK